MIACQAVARFIAVRWENPELAIPLLATYGAFADPKRGVKAELFSTDEPIPRSRSSLRDHVRMWAAVCLEVLMELGEPLAVARELVARHVSSWAGMEGSAVTGVTVENWRNTWRAKGTTERQQFEQIRNHFLRTPDLSEKY